MTAKATPKRAGKAPALLTELGYVAEESMARLLDVEIKTLRNRHDLPPRYKLGRKSVYRVVEIQAWLARRSTANRHAAA